MRLTTDELKYQHQILKDDCHYGCNMHAQTIRSRVRIQNISFATLTGFNTPVSPHTTID